MPASSPTDRLALSPVSIPQCDFASAFEMTARAGFSGIGLRYDQLAQYLASGHSILDVRNLARSYGLEFAEAGFLAEWQYHSGIPLVCQRRRSGSALEDRAALLRQLKVAFEHCEQLECPNITAATAIYDTGDLAVAAEDFAYLCDLARPYGLRLCLEFFGLAPQVHDVASAAQLVAAADRQNGGMVIDTFFFHQGGSSLADLETIDIGRVFNVQLADAKLLPRTELDMLRDRLFPGEGAAPISSIASILRRRGYRGWWTVELFNPEYRELDAEWVARKAFESAQTTLDRALRE